MEVLVITGYRQINMATIRLTASSYYLSSSTYLYVTGGQYMYNNTDGTQPAMVTNSRASTAAYYIYLRGFNFDDIPSGAVVTSFVVKIKAKQQGVTTSSSYAPKLANGTSALTSTCPVITTTTNVLEFTGVTASWDTIVGYGSKFGIRLPCGRASRNVSSTLYIYGAEIEVTYTLPDPRTITTSVSGNGTSTCYDGDEVEVVITPTNKSDTVTATRDGADITAQLVAVYSTGGSLDHYTYTFTVSGNTTIAVVIGGASSQAYIYDKTSSGWTKKTIVKMYVKTSSGWTETTTYPTAGDYIRS